MTNHAAINTQLQYSLLIIRTQQNATTYTTLCTGLVHASADDARSLHEERTLVVTTGLTLLSIGYTMPAQLNYAKPGTGVLSLLLFYSLLALGNCVP